jgi:hypothetical protein
LRFAETLRYRPFALIAPNFVQVESAQPPVGRRADGLLITSERPAAPFVAVELQVQTTLDGMVLAGLGTHDGDHVLASYDFRLGRVTIELRTGGQTRVAASQSIALHPPFGFAFALCENQVTALTDTGEGWQPVVTTRRTIAAVLDLRNAEILDRFCYAYGTRPTARHTDKAADRSTRIRGVWSRVTRPRLTQDASRYQAEEQAVPDNRPVLAAGSSTGAVADDQAAVSAAAVSRVRAGPFGLTGVRDPHLVQRPDGTPYIRDGRLYLTMTCAGMGFFQQAHWGVFTLDLDELTSLEQVSQLYFVRDGLVLGDHAGQIIVDDDRYIVAVSSWGDFAPGEIHIRHTVTDRNVLSGVHLIPTEPLPLPTEMGSWDPALTWLDDRWYLGFVESPSQSARFDFHPALAVGARGADYTGPFQLIGADDSLHQCEGPVLAKLDGDWRLLASDSDLREYPVYDLNMRRLGSLDAPYLSNIPHPQVVTIDGADGLRHLIVTFDGTPYAVAVLGYGGHGDLVILEAAGPG